MLRVENIEGVIWDWDGVLQSFIPFSESLEHWHQAAVRAFNNVAPCQKTPDKIYHDTCMELARMSFDKRGLSTAYFTEHFNLDAEVMHIEFHRQAEYKKVASINEGLALELEKLSHLKHVILTQGSKEWVQCGILLGGFKDIFAGVTILGLENCGMQKKSTSALPFNLAIQAIGLPADRLVMVEDMKKNLVIPKDMEIQTVFIAQSGLEAEWLVMPTKEDDYIDLSVERTVDFVHALAPVIA